MRLNSPAQHYQLIDNAIDAIAYLIMLDSKLQTYIKTTSQNQRA